MPFDKGQKPIAEALRRIQFQHVAADYDVVRLLRQRREFGGGVVNVAVERTGLIGAFGIVANGTSTVG